MTVKEVFELRKQGRVEEAYAAIRPLYAAHKGRYTTLCMFWTASDVLKKRLRERRTAEAEQIFWALLRVLRSIDDSDGKALSGVLRAATLLSRQSATFSTLLFLDNVSVDQFSPSYWQPTMLPATAQRPRRSLPAVAEELLACAFGEIEAAPTVENALRVMPLLQEAMRHQPLLPQNRRYMDAVYRIISAAEARQT